MMLDTSFDSVKSKAMQQPELKKLFASMDVPPRVSVGCKSRKGANPEKLKPLTVQLHVTSVRRPAPHLSRTKAALSSDSLVVNPGLTPFAVDPKLQADAVIDPAGGRVLHET